MKARSRSLIAGSLIVLLFVSSSSAHYLWVTVTKKGGKHGTTNIYFEHGPGPGTGEYLDPFVKRGKTWLRTVEKPKPKLIKIADVKKAKTRWLTGEIPGGTPRSIDSYGMFGVYRYGKKDVLLHYYARNLQVSNHEELHELGRAEKMALDIVPHDTPDAMEATVLWHGKNATKLLVYVRGPKGFKENIKTDDQGKIRFKTKEKGRYTLRTLVTEANKSGEVDGMKYVEVRHHATLTMTLPIEG